MCYRGSPVMPRAPGEALTAAARSTGSIPGTLAHEQPAGFQLLLLQVPISANIAGSCWALGQQGSPSK